MADGVLKGSEVGSNYPSTDWANQVAQEDQSRHQEAATKVAKNSDKDAKQKEFNDLPIEMLVTPPSMFLLERTLALRRIQIGHATNGCNVAFIAPRFDPRSPPVLPRLAVLYGLPPAASRGGRRGT